MRAPWASSGKDTVNVDARPGIAIAAIARRAPQTQQALSQIAARLETLGYLDRRLADRGRGIGLHLTAAGARARTSAHEAIETFEAELATVLGAGRHARLLDVLEETRTIVRDLDPRAGVRI